MRMTAEIFFTVWEREHKTARAAAGRSPVILRHIQLLNEKGDPRLYEEDVLYVCGSELFTGDEDGPSCAVDETLSGATLLSAVTDCWNRIFAWDHHICERILNGQSAEKILPLGKECLPYPYMLVDREMQVLYRTADYREEIGEPEETFLRGNMIPPELVQSLLLSKKFHEAALRPSAFYYYENHNDRRNYCRNIFLDGQYYARLLMLLPENAERFLPGEEELFDLFADRTEQLCMRDARFLRRKRADSLHQVCSALDAGENISMAIAEAAMQRSGWMPAHTFLAGTLEFFSKPGWHTQIEYTLPYLVSCIEQTWPHSCAWIREDKVCFAADLTLTAQVGSGKNKKGETAEKAGSRENEGQKKRSALRDFCAELAVLVRENICRAGLSSCFNDFLKLPDALEQARSALRLGQQRAPQRWYHLFDDYRMEYVLEMLRTQGSMCLIPHPALGILRASDVQYGTEYIDTLRAYFEAGRNMTAAADRIFIHRTSFCRRMDRIRELSGIDPGDSDAMLELELALRLEDPWGQIPRLP